MCRQFMREFCSLEMPILLVPSDYPQPENLDNSITKGRVGVVGEDGVRETTLGDLLPDSFGPEHLHVSISRPGE